MIDDDEAIRRSLTFLLRTAGILVRTYESGEEFLREAGQLPAGCVITDVRMPEVGGIDLLANVAYMQDYDGDDVSVSVGDDGNFKFGYGARIGLLQESIISPGVRTLWKVMSSRIQCSARSARIILVAVQPTFSPM